MFEFASKNAALGFKLNELALRIVENDELATFINKVGNKLCKESEVTVFERAIINRILENATIISQSASTKEIKESIDLGNYYNRYDYIFI
jgi:hypothetical protein